MGLCATSYGIHLRHWDAGNDVDVRLYQSNQMFMLPATGWRSWRTPKGRLGFGVGGWGWTGGNTNKGHFLVAQIDNLRSSDPKDRHCPVACRQLLWLYCLHKGKARDFAELYCHTLHSGSRWHLFQICEPNSFVYPFWELSFLPRARSNGQSEVVEGNNTVLLSITVYTAKLLSRNPKPLPRKRSKDSKGETFSDIGLMVKVPYSFGCKSCMYYCLRWCSWILEILLRRW